MKTPRHILVFLTDQQNSRTLEPAWNVMPFLTGLPGTTFTNAFTPSPICTPARASLQTGMLPHQHKLVHNCDKNTHIVDDMAESTSTLGNLFQTAGFRTSYFGKWHAGRHRMPLDYGYEVYDACAQRAPRIVDGEVRIDGPTTDRRLLIGGSTGFDASESGPLFLARRIVEEFRHLAVSGKRGFIFASTLVPHIPFHCPKNFLAAFDGLDFPPPDSFLQEPGTLPHTLRKHYNKHNLFRIAPDVERFQATMRLYFGVTRLIDHALEEIVRELKASGLYEETAIVFTSDHGELMGDHGFFGKGEVLYDSVLRVPMLFKGPCFDQRTVRSHVHLTDLYSTLADIAEIEGPRPAASRSFINLLRKSEDTPLRTVTFAEHHGSSTFNTIRSIRTEHWKYIYHAHGDDELFDLTIDAGETRNLSADPSRRAVKEDLQRQLVDWMKAQNDPHARGAEYALLENPLRG